MITEERLKHVLDYNPKTGVFIWKVVTGNRAKIGGVAGYIATDKPNNYRYRTIRIDKSAYRASRLAWLWMTGSFPNAEIEIDHKDGNSLNNRWCNLRLATKPQNQFNSKISKNNKSGFKGVHLHGNGRWRAQLQVNGTRVHIGVFNTPEDAHAAYCVAAKKHFGDYARAGCWMFLAIALSFVVPNTVTRANADGCAAMRDYAQRSANDMAHKDSLGNHDYFHASPHYGAENIGYGYKSEAAMTAAWWRSPHHAANMRLHYPCKVTAVARSASGKLYYAMEIGD